MVISWTRRFIRDNNDEDTSVVYGGGADGKLRVSKRLQPGEWFKKTKSINRLLAQ